jgi:hypothetical protein
MTLFSYHSGQQALVVHDPATGRPMGGVKTSTLRAAGFKCDDAALLVALPRTGNELPQPQIRPPTQAEMAKLAKMGRGR